MTDIVPVPNWGGVRQLETNEYATGGLNGNMNEQAKSLAGQNMYSRLYAGLPFDPVFTAQVGGFPIGGKAALENGDIAQSTIANNTNDPNVDMTGWEFENTRYYDSFSEMNSAAAVAGVRARTVSYHEGLGYGGADYIYDGTEWVIQPKNSTVSIEQFGARCGEKPAATFNVYPDETTDNTAIVQAAYNYVADNGLRQLIIENVTKCFFFESMAWLQFFRNISFDFGGALFFFSLQLRPDIKNAPMVEISNTRKEISGLEVTTNGYMGYGIEFSRATGDNQAATVKKFRAYTCRRGLVVDEAECINRIRFENCDFTSNYYEGIYINSFVTAWAHSAPVFFRDCIVNGSGPQDWILNTDAKLVLRNGTSISVRDTSTDVAKGQLYMRGISGGHWLGGQISNHGGGRCNSLAMLHNTNMVTLDSFDLEDFDSYSTDGTKITASNYLNYINDRSGAAIVADACVGLSIRSPNIFSIRAPAVLKLSNNPASYDYQVATPASGFAYTVWDLSNPANGIGANFIHPYALIYGEGVSPIAFASAANKDGVSSIIHHETGNADYTVDWRNLKTLWQNGQVEATNGYLLRYLSNHDQKLTSGASGHLYNEFIFPTQISGSKPDAVTNWVFAELMHNQSADGRFVIQALDASNAVLSSQWHNPSEATHYPISNWVRMKVPTGTKKLRFGFVNSQNYIGYVGINYWSNSAKRYNDWHTTVYITKDGNGAFRNKIRKNYSACVDVYRANLVQQAETVAQNTVNLAGAATLADVIAAVNALAASDNAVKTTLKNSGAIKLS